MYEDVAYAKPFLAEVILRVDFSAPIEQLRKALPSSVGNAAIKHFPISEPRAGFAQELEISKGEFKPKQREEFTEWNYYGRDREKRLAISPTYVFVSYSKYTKFEALKEDFFGVAQSICAQYPETRCGRLGLRYINRIELDEGDPFDWGSYIDERLLGLFQRFMERERLTRVFHIVELKYDDVQLKCQFGAPNPDFPAPIRRPVFVLDFDGVVHGLQDLTEIAPNTDKAHEIIQQLFEESITDDLRGLMNDR